MGLRLGREVEGVETISVVFREASWTAPAETIGIGICVAMAWNTVGTLLLLGVTAAADHLKSKRV
jgi:hypothetical protein